MLSQIYDTRFRLDLVSVSLGQRDLAPNRHVGGAVRALHAVPADALNHAVPGKLAAILSAQRGQVGRLNWYRRQLEYEL